ncbi:MAG TPA: hypothetical protein DCG19_07280, partial [Cryomorphaceae bacterium]|nr:hypothetical protein [Cryomorphaceae bacterium]
MRFIFAVLVLFVSVESFGQDLRKQFLMDMYNAQFEFLHYERDKSSDIDEYSKEIGIITRALNKAYEHELKGRGFVYDFYQTRILDSILFVIEMHSLSYHSTIVYRINDTVYRKSFKVDPRDKETQIIVKEECFKGIVDMSSYREELNMDCS